MIETLLSSPFTIRGQAMPPRAIRVLYNVICSVRLIRKRKRHQYVGHFPSEVSASSSSNDNELLSSFLPKISNWSSVRTCFEVGRPQLLASFSIESSESAVYRRANEYHSAAGHDRPSKVRRSSDRLQPIYNPEWHFPGDLSRVHVHSIERSPRRFLARPLILVPEAGVLAFFGPPPILHRRVRGLRFHRSNGSQLIRIYKQIAGSTIKRSPGPIPSTQCAGDHQRLFAAVRCIHSMILERMKQLSAIAIGFR